MPRFFIAIIAALLLSGWGTEADARRTEFGIDVAALGFLALGDHERIAGPGLGALVGLEAEVTPGIGLTVRGGHIQQMTRGDYTRSMRPVLGGFKLTSYSSPFYFAGEAGRAHVRDDYKGDALLPGPDRRVWKTAWGGGVGAAADRLDLRLSFHVWNADRMSESMTIGISLGFLIVGS